METVKSLILKNDPNAESRIFFPNTDPYIVEAGGKEILVEEVHGVEEIYQQIHKKFDIPFETFMQFKEKAKKKFSTEFLTVAAGVLGAAVVLLLAGLGKR
jgi:hypothetical protein